MTEWRYLPGEEVKHRFSGGYAGTTADCGAYVVPAYEWHGTGSQIEYETAEQLPPCPECIAPAGPAPRENLEDSLPRG